MGLPPAYIRMPLDGSLGIPPLASFKHSMSRSSSSRDYQNRSHTGGYLNDDGEMQAAKPDHMFNALMDQYLSNAASSTVATSVGYDPSLRPQHMDSQSAQPLRQATSPSVGHVHASQSPIWNSAAPNPGYGQPNRSVPGTGAHFHGGEQPSFSDLMRELSHEQSRAL